METIRFKTAKGGEAAVVARNVMALLPPSDLGLPYNDRDYIALHLINGMHILAHNTLDEMEEKLNLIGLGFEDA